MQTVTTDPKEPRLRTVFFIFAAIVGVFGFGVDLMNSHPTWGMPLMGISVIYGVWELFRSPTIAVKIAKPLRVALGIGLCIVFVLIVSLRHHPQRFTGYIDEIFFADDVSPTGQRTGTASTGFLVILKNTGSPSSAENYRLSIKSNNLDRQGTEPFVLPDGRDPMITWFRGTPIAVAKREDFLYSKTVHAISSGDTVCGWLVFDFGGVTRDQLMDPSGKWELSFLDVDNIRQIIKLDAIKFQKWKRGIPPPPQCGANQFYVDPNAGK